MIELMQIIFNNMKPIKNDKDYEVALDRLDQIFDAKAGTKEGDEADS